MSRYSYKRGDAPPDDAFAPIPDGWYTAEIVDSEAKQTKAGDGEYFNFRWKVLGPTHAGRVIFEIIMWESRKPETGQQAQDIGRRTLDGLLCATGLEEMNYLQDLHCRPCEIKVGTERSEAYGDKNRVKGHRPLGGYRDNDSRPPQSQPHAPQGSPAAKGSWGRQDAPPPIGDDDIPW